MGCKCHRWEDVIQFISRYDLASQIQQEGGEQLSIFWNAFNKSIQYANLTDTLPAQQRKKVDTSYVDFICHQPQIITANDLIRWDICEEVVTKHISEGQDLSPLKILLSLNQNAPETEEQQIAHENVLKLISQFTNKRKKGSDSSSTQHTVSSQFFQPAPINASDTSLEAVIIPKKNQLTAEERREAKKARRATRNMLIKLFGNTDVTDSSSDESEEEPTETTTPAI